MPGPGVVHVELTAPREALTSGSVPVLRLLVTHDGVPVAYDEVADPGPGGGPWLLDLLLGDLPDATARRAAAEARLAARMGVPETSAPAALDVSVIVCTRRRPGTLRDLLAALTRLDPAPLEVVVVDNDPGELSAEAAVREHGFTYVREDRPGLNRARAVGLAHAGGEVVIYVDDDCVPPAPWLRGLGRRFADPSVGAVTGPAFAWELRTPAQLRFEREDGFRRGLAERRFDWSLLPPVRATAAGAGANLAFRRSALAGLPDPFPPELDAGTPTQSGGDMWALAGVLAAGWRVHYGPEGWVHHQHRPGPAAMHHALWGYGVGLGSTLLKLALERRELSAPAAWCWVLQHYLAGTAARAAGRGDAVRQRLGWDYLRGGLSAPAKYVAARRAMRADPPPPRPASGGAPAAAAPPPAHVVVATAPELSVVVPTHRRPDAVRELVAALADQAAAPPFELVLVDDAGDAVAPAAPFPVRLLRGDGRGPAAARNLGAHAAAGPLLLLLDDDLVPGRGCLAAHAAAHADGGARLAVGACPPRPPGDAWVQDIAAWWWWDQLAARRTAGAPTFKDVLTGNLSVRRATLRELGGLREEFGRRRREDWDLGLRATRAGIPIVTVDAAVAEHRFRLDTAAHVRSAYAEGAGDALLLAEHPEAAAALPVGAGYGRWGARHPVRAVVATALRGPRGRDAAVAVLDLLERVRARRTWARLLGVAHAAAYRAGLRAAGARGHVRAAAASTTIELDGAAAAVPPPILGDVRVVAPDGTVGMVRGPELHWNRELARRAVAAVPYTALPPAGVHTAAPPAAPPPVLTWERGGGWPAVDRALHGMAADRVAILLPGSPAPGGWLAAAASVAGLPRVAVVHGGVLPWGPASVPPLVLYERRQVSPCGRPPGSAPTALVVDRAQVLALGGFAAEPRGGPPLVAVYALLERALAAGLVGAALDRSAPPSWAARRASIGQHAADGALAVARGQIGRLAAATLLDLAAVARPRAARRAGRAAAAVARVAGAARMTMERRG